MTSPLPPANHTVEERILTLEQQQKELHEQIIRLEKNSIRLVQIFQPWVGFLFACAFTITFALFSFAVFEGQKLNHYITYMTPIMFPFIGFIFDRIEWHIRKLSFLARVTSFGLDIILLVVSLVRYIYPVPYISGHAVFLAYALLTVKSWWVRIPAIIVLIEVIYFKVVVWDDATLYGGLLVGGLAAILWWVLRKKIN